MAKYGTKKDKEEFIKISEMFTKMGALYAELVELVDKEDTIDNQNQADIITMRILRLAQEMKDFDI